MNWFVIVEVDDGFEVIEVMPGQSGEDAAMSVGATLVDSGPYHSYDDASEAMDRLGIVEDRDSGI